MFLALPLVFLGFKVGLSKYFDFMTQRLRFIAQCRPLLRNYHDRLLCRSIVALPLYIETLSQRLLSVCVFADDYKSMEHKSCLFS